MLHSILIKLVNAHNILYVCTFFVFHFFFFPLFYIGASVAVEIIYYLEHLFSSHFLHLCNIVSFLFLKYSSLVLCICIMVLTCTRNYVLRPMLSNGMSPRIDYTSPLVVRSYLFFKVVFQHKITNLLFVLLVCCISQQGRVNPFA